MCLWTGVFSVITEGPENILVVRCVNESADMTCVSDTDDKIVWKYQKIKVITKICEPVSEYENIFHANKLSSKECGISAQLEGVKENEAFGTISGPYACEETDSTTTKAVATVILLGILLSGIIFYTFENASAKLHLK